MFHVPWLFEILEELTANMHTKLFKVLEKSVTVICNLISESYDGQTYQ